MTSHATTGQSPWTQYRAAGEKVRFEEIVREQENAQSTVSTFDQGDFLDDEALAAYLESIKVDENNGSMEATVALPPVDPILANDLMLAQALQELESSEYIEAASNATRYSNTKASNHESVRVQSMEETICFSDPTDSAPVRQVRSSAWSEAQALERKALLKQDPSKGNHNQVSSFSRHEPLLRALR